MASLIAASLDPNPADRPTRVVALTYLTGVLTGSGGVFDIWLGTESSSTFFGLSGGYLAITGIFGFVFGLGIIALGLRGWWFPKTARQSGRTIIALSILSLVTSFFGFFFVGCVIGIASGFMTIRAKPRRESPPPDWRTEKPPPLPVYSSPNEGAIERRT